MNNERFLYLDRATGEITIHGSRATACLAADVKWTQVFMDPVEMVSEPRLVKPQDGIPLVVQNPRFIRSRDGRAIVGVTLACFFANAEQRQTLTPYRFPRQ